ncbi:sugar ABC transporter permease [Parasalinivibrio latis]|uniref:carbohydrate ABC transporter permease n=1 Tax=Parasalinivibrio latis TaxID=2952610 RepID=UPI0030E1E3E4
MSSPFTLKKNLPYLLVLPGLILSSFVILYPLWAMFELATHKVNRFGKLKGFSGLENFEKLLSDPLFYESAFRTLVWTIAVVALTVIVSLFVAQLLNEKFYGRSIARTIIMLPWAISLTMTAIVWRWALNGQFGLLNKSFMDLGIIDAPLDWLASAELAFPMQIFIGVLVSVPFTVTIILGGLSSVPTDIYEAARVEGATGWQQYRKLTLPLLKPFIHMAVVLNTIYVFNSFPIIWILTQGGPANSTEILVTYLYKMAFKLGKLGEASAISLAMFALLMGLTFVYLRTVMKNEQGGS